MDDYSLGVYLHHCYMEDPLSGDRRLASVSENFLNSRKDIPMISL